MTSVFAPAFEPSGSGSAQYFIASGIRMASQPARRSADAEKAIAQSNNFSALGSVWAILTRSEFNKLSINVTNEKYVARR